MPRSMRPPRVVVLRILSKNPPQVPLPEEPTIEVLEGSRLDAFAFSMTGPRPWHRPLEDRIRGSRPLLGEFPSAPRKDAPPVRVYLAKP